MEQRFVDPSSKEVEELLKQFHNPTYLETSPASHWPAVREKGNHGVVHVVRDVLKQALEQLEAGGDHRTTVLRARYVDGQRIEDLADNRYKFDASTLHRWRKEYLKELQVIIGELNRAAQRRVRAQRFAHQGPIVGIQHLAEELAAHIGDGDAEPVLVLEGMGGLGKTTLARLIARRIAHDDAFAGVLWTSAQQTGFDVHAGKQRTLQPSAIRVEDLVKQLAHELGMEHTGDGGDLRTDVVATCKRTQYLIVFDNLETLEDMDAIAPLIDALAVPSRILITTRDRAPETLPPTIKRRYVALEELAPAPSFQLLRAAAKHAGMSTLRNADDDDLAQIYGVTGGNPLALLLVAGQSDSLPWRAFLQELTAHRSANGKVEEVYTYLYRRAWTLLSANAQRVFLAMHLFERGTSYDALQDVVDLERAPFQDAVEELRHRMLLLFDGPDAVFVHRFTYTFIHTGLLGW